MSARPVPSSVSRPRSTNTSEFGASGGAASGIWVTHGCRSSISRWTVAHIRSRGRQPSPLSTRPSAPSALAFHMSCSSSSLLATCRYSDMVVKPSSCATRAIDTASRPSASASRMAASAIAPADSPARGPRFPRSRRPQRRSSPGGSGAGSSAWHIAALLPVIVASHRYIYTSGHRIGASPGHLTKLRTLYTLSVCDTQLMPLASLRPSATSSFSTASIWPSRPDRSSPSSGRTARARPRWSASSPRWSARTRAPRPWPAMTCSPTRSASAARSASPASTPPSTTCSPVTRTCG